MLCQFHHKFHHVLHILFQTYSLRRFRWINLNYTMPEITVSVRKQIVWSISAICRKGMKHLSLAPKGISKNATSMFHRCCIDLGSHFGDILRFMIEFISMEHELFDDRGV